MKKNKKKILVIDDEPEVTMMVKSRLESQQYNVVTAFNADGRGWKEFRRKNPIWSFRI